MTSLASDEPPGLSMRSTTARTVGSSRSCLIVSCIEYEPTSRMSTSGMCCERPSTMSPSR